MKHLRIGDQVIGLDHLQYARRNAPQKGGLRMHFDRGWKVDLDGDEAAEVWAALCRAVPESLGQPKSSSDHDVPVRRRPPPRK